jgi:nucleotide-binding universal stress UspA family protein
MTAPASCHLDASHRIVVAIDFTEPSIAAATWVAQHFAPGAELVLLHVLYVPPLARFLEGRYLSTDRLVEAARAGAETRLRELSTSIATGLVWPEVRVGKPDVEIVRVAAEYSARLVVIGRPATRPGLWGRIGTTAQRVLRRSPVPVLLAAGTVPHQPSRLLIAVDDSDIADAVLEHGGLLAERFGAEVTVMHVVSVPIFPGATAVPDGLPWRSDEAHRDLPVEGQLATREAENWLRLRIETSGHRGRMTPLVVSAHARPDEIIVEEARRREVGLILVGSTGAGAVPRLLLGSVAEGVLRGADCPVLAVVPPGDASRDDMTATAGVHQSAMGEDRERHA